MEQAEMKEKAMHSFRDNLSTTEGSFALILSVRMQS